MLNISYNEFDPYTAQWLRNLIANGDIPMGDVDERDVREVSPDGYGDRIQAHFFAGIGVWSAALHQAGWPEIPVWTGSCPCQPFSSAGRRKGTKDERHLWPIWKTHINVCRPPIVFGEQVASRAGRNWLGTVRSEMEEM
jgi:DNA (cytosine-5)-methyltransferase 1